MLFDVWIVGNEFGEVFLLLAVDFLCLLVGLLYGCYLGYAHEYVEGLMVDAVADRLCVAIEGGTDGLYE